MRFSRTTWLETRHLLGQARDRAGALAYTIQAGNTTFEWQQRAHLADVTHPALMMHKLIIGGLGGGKSDWAWWEGIMLAMMNPGQGIKGMISGPTFDVLKQEIKPRWEDGLDKMSAAKTPLCKRFHKTELRYELWCGASVYLRSLDQFESFRTWQLAWWYGEELESMMQPLRVWNVLSKRVRQPKAYVRQAYAVANPRGYRGTVKHFIETRRKARALPTAHVDEHGREYVTKTVRGVEHLIPRDELIASHYTFRATSLDNPTLGDDYLLGLETMSERRYREEVLAEILQPESIVWPEFDARKHVFDIPCPWIVRSDGTTVQNPQWVKALGHHYPLDYACDAGDQFPHSLWIARLPGDVCVVVGELCEDGWPLSKLHDEIIRRTVCYGRSPDNVVGDRAVPDEIGWMIQTWKRATPHKMVRRIEQDVLTGVEVVRDRAAPIFGDPKILFARHIIEAPPRRGIWNCVRNYRYQAAADGSFHPRPFKDNVHDHGADALRMHQVALFGGDGKPRFFSTGRKW